MKNYHLVLAAIIGPGIQAWCNQNNPSCDNCCGDPENDQEMFRWCWAHACNAKVDPYDGVPYCRPGNNYLINSYPVGCLYPGPCHHDIPAGKVCPQSLVQGGWTSGEINPGYQLSSCQLVTPVLWNIRFECGNFNTALSSDETLSDKFHKLHDLQTEGDCDKVSTKMFIENNKNNKVWTAPWNGAAPTWNGVGDITAAAHSLHVLIVIDMDVDDDVYWTDTMPNKIKNHLDKVNFPFGSTFEVVLAGPNNIFIQYPISKPSMDELDSSMVNQYTSTFSFINRKRRSSFCNKRNPTCEACCEDNPPNPMHYCYSNGCVGHSDGIPYCVPGSYNIIAHPNGCWYPGNCYHNPKAGKTCSSLGYFNGEVDGSTNHQCHIFDKDVLFQRLFAATNSMPALPKSIYSVAGLSRPDHIGWISAYLHRYVPKSGNTLVMHVMNHESEFDQADIVSYHNFIEHLEENRPNLNMRHHFMFAGKSHGMIQKMVDLGVTMSSSAKWSSGLNANRVTQTLVDSFGIGGGVGGITDPVVTVAPSTGTSCSNQPCRNGCTCEQSCRDENDYVCVPPAGRPFVGKNCEWEAVVQCTADRSIRVSIPKEAVNQYAMGVSNVVLQGCNNAPSYICNNAMGMPAPSCGPVLEPTGNFYVLECPTNSLVRTSSGEFSFGQTIVFDRSSSLVAMPHPIVNVQCMMATRPAISVIAPQLRGPQSLTQTIFWQPMFGFYKTSWGSHPMILAGNSIVGSGEVGYIVGERIHVRITASLNGIPAATLPGKHQMTMLACTITPAGSGGNVIPIISNGLPVAGTPFPVSVAQDPGLLGGGVAASAEGVGFSFQVFTYGPGSKLQLTCIVNINSARRRRSAVNETENETEQVTAKLLIFAIADEEKSDIQTIAMIQDPTVEVVYMEPEDRAVQIENLKHFILSELPTWFLCLVGMLVILVLVLAVFLIKRRYSVKYDDYDDTKVRLFN